MTDFLAFQEEKAREYSLTNTPSLHKFTPFDTNYTLTGLIKHIETSLAELIHHKQTLIPTQPFHQELQKLVKIHQDVTVLRNIIIHNINQIFNNIYPRTHKPIPNTDHTISPHSLATERISSQQTQQILSNKQFSNLPDNKELKEMTITQFEADIGIGKGDKINNLEINRQSLSHHNAIYSKQSERMTVYHEQECEADRIEEMRRKFVIKPFELIDCNSNIRIEDDNQFQLDFVCYEDSSTIPRSNIWKCQQNKKEEFSPISERPVQEEETVGKCSQGNHANLTFLPQNPIILGMNQREIQKKLFAQTTRVILPKRCHRKKFNYLQQAKQI